MGWLRDPYIACNLQPQQIPGPRHQINCKIATTQDIYPLSQPLSNQNRQKWVVSTWRFSRYDSGYAIRRQRVPLVPFFPSDPKNWYDSLACMSCFPSGPCTTSAQISTTDSQYRGFGPSPKNATSCLATGRRSRPSTSGLWRDRGLVNRSCLWGAGSMIRVGVDRFGEEMAMSLKNAKSLCSSSCPQRL